MPKKIIDLLLIGSGLASLNFAETYLDKNKKKKLNIICPLGNKALTKKNIQVGFLPSQMENCNKEVNNFFVANQIYNEKSSKVIGSLKIGGLSNYWGLQMDNNISPNLNVTNKIYKDININFIEFLKKNKVLGDFFYKKKNLYSNKYKIDNFYEHFNSNKNFKVEKPILGFFTKKNKKKEINLNEINESKAKINFKNYLKKINKRKIKFHDYYVTKIERSNNIIKVFCEKIKKKKIFYCKKIVFATGTIATTKIMMDYLKIKNEVKIKHHPRLVSAYISRISINSKLKFTPSLLQLISKKKSLNFTADIRPGNNFISNSIVELLPFLKGIKFLINFFKKNLIFSNILASSKYSNLFIKKDFNRYKIYSKKNFIIKKLKNYQRETFKFLAENKIIYPLYKNFFPGYGSDFHYFGTILMNKKKKLSVNENCQLNKNNNIYIIDGSIFDFKDNKYPLGILMSNARRIGKIIK